MSRSAAPNLSGQMILVTGASSGIGRATAILLSHLGARLLLNGQNPERLAQTQSELSGSDHHCVPFDLSQSGDIPPWIKQLAAQHGPLHGLVHCAGLHAFTPLSTLQVAKVETLLRVNVTSAMFLIKGLRQRSVSAPGASFVLVSSVAGLAGQSALSAYSATKAALLGFGRSAAIELAREGLRVNCIAPGLVETDMTARLRDQLTPSQFEAIQQMHPLGLGTPEDVANAAAFLLSPASRWITGSTLVVDGGYSAH